MNLAKDNGRGGGGRRRECWVCVDPDHLSFECLNCEDSDDDTKGGRGRLAGRRPRRESKSCKEKLSTKCSAGEPGGGSARWRLVESVRTMLLHMGVQHHWRHLALWQAVWRGWKLVPKARWDLHLGMSEESTGWAVLNLTDNKVVTTLEVVFYETMLLELDPDMHADPKHRWDIAMMIVKEALASWKGKAVKAAMDEEIRSLIANGTWVLVEQPPGVNIMKNQSVLITKYHIDDTVEHKKARLVVMSFTQVYGANYDETYAPFGSYVTMRIFLSIIDVLDLNRMQLDMKNTFL
ncbi:unnamed protein product [Closterium sp. NIES-54]